jgi:predicted GIY-YIG superfamily endonuclease
MSEEDTRTPSSVYMIYSESGELIYVGITDRGHQRQAEHLAKQPWAWEVAETHWEHYESRAIAANRETALIRSQNPKYNKIHKVAGEPSKIEFRLRAQQYDLLRKTLHSTESLGGEVRKALKNYEMRIEANEKITRYLLRAIRDEEPLDEAKLKKIDRYLKHSENLAKQRNARNRKTASKLNPVPEAKRAA